MAPSFLRTLLYPNVDNLQLPTTFVSKHMSNQFPKEIKIQSADGRCTWRLKIHKNGENYFFGNGWKNVVEDAHLGILDSMTFELVDKSTFKMVTYSQDGCQKDFPPKVHVQDNVDVLGGPVAICRGQSPLPSGPVAICRGQSPLPSGPVAICRGQSPLPSGPVAIRPGQSPIPRGPVATPTVTFNVSWPLNDLNDVVVDVDDLDDDDDVDDDEDDVDDEVTFDKILAQSHYERLPLPAEFVKLAKIESNRTIMLKNNAGNEWSVGIRSATSSGFRTYRLSSGWTEFWRSNRLSVGDKCVFKYIRSEDKLCVFKATK